MLFFLLILLAVGLLLCIIYFARAYDDRLVSKSYVNIIVQTSPFFDRMSTYDLYARKATSKEEYKNMYVESVRAFSKNEIHEINTLLEKVDCFTIYCYKLHAIPWKLAKIDTSIEQGFPHTLGDVIFLSDEFFHLNKNNKISILIHEKIHIFQRLYPNNTERLIIDYWNFRKIKFMQDEYLARNNPDINEYIYGKDGWYIVQVYSSHTPSSILHSTPVVIRDDTMYDLHNIDIGITDDVSQAEHPYEVMGSYLPKILMNEVSDKTHPFYVATKKWLNDGNL